MEPNNNNNNNAEENKNNDTANENSNPNPATPPPVKAEASSAAQQQQQQVALKVVNADGAEMFFRIRRGTQLKKLIDAYCKKQGISRGSVRFLFDGSPIDESKTP